MTPPPPRHLLARTPRAASAGGEGCWGLGTTAPSPPTAATGQLRVGGDSGQGEGYSGAEGPFCAQPDDRRGGRGCRPGEGGGGGSNPAVRTGGEGWDGEVWIPYRTRTDLDRVKGQGAGGWCL